MIYTNCLPYYIVKLVAASPDKMSGREIAETLNASLPRVQNVLPVLVRDGKLLREGSRKKFRYWAPAKAEVAVAGPIPEHHTDTASTDATWARLQALERRLAALKNAPAETPSEDTKAIEEFVTPVRSEE